MLVEVCERDGSWSGENSTGYITYEKQLFNKAKKR